MPSANASKAHSLTASSNSSAFAKCRYAAVGVTPDDRLLVRPVGLVRLWALSKGLDVPVTALYSTLGRTAARGLETKLIAGWAKEFYNQLLANIKNGDTRTANHDRWHPVDWPAEARGVGLTEAPVESIAGT